MSEATLLGGSCYQKDNLLKKDEVNISTDRHIEMNQNKK